MDENKLLILIGFAIVVVVALNLALVLGNMFKLGSGMQMISGFAVAECKNTIDGVMCGDTIYEVKATTCSDDLVPVCTNACELERAQSKDDRICPTYCTEFCLPLDIAEYVLNTKNSI